MSIDGFGDSDIVDSRLQDTIDMMGRKKRRRRKRNYSDLVEG